MLALLVVVAIGAGSIVALLTLNEGSPSPPSGSAGAPSSAPQPSSVPAPPPGITFRDFAVDPTVVRSPTNSAAQSKLWYADDAWWAALFGPTTNRLGIYRLDPATHVWADTGILIDERPFADADMLWTGDHLYTIAGGSRRSDSHSILIRRFTYDAEDQRFTLDSNFPVVVRPLGSSPPVIAVDSAGTVWATFIADGRVWLTHALEHDSAWAAPFALDGVEAQVDEVDVSTIVAFGPGKLGVLWTNQRSGVHFSMHEDGAPDAAWSPAETVLAGPLPDDTLSATAIPLPDGGTSVAAVASTTLDIAGSGSRSLDPLTLLATRDATGTWDTTLVGLVRDRHARPIVMVDSIAGTVTVAATSPGNGGVIYYKRSAIERIEFDTGLGVPFMTSPSDTTLDNVTGAKGPLTERAGMLLLASDRTTGRYVHGYVDLGAGPPEADPRDPQRPTQPKPPPARTTTAYFRDSFEPWEIGPIENTGWYVRAEDPPESLTIVSDLARGKALNVPSSPTGVRACRDFPEVGGTTLVVQMRVRFSRVGLTDTTLMSVRGSGGEAASLRVTDRGAVAWFNGTTKIRTATVVRPGTWYRVVAFIDQANRRYLVRLLSDGGTPIVAGRGLRWRMPSVRTVRTLCVETAAGGPVQNVTVADATVLQRVAS